MRTLTPGCFSASRLPGKQVWRHQGRRNSGGRPGACLHQDEALASFGGCGARAQAGAAAGDTVRTGQGAEALPGRRGRGRREEGREGPGGPDTSHLVFIFLGPHLQHMEVPRLGVKSELLLLAYATGTATQDL